MTADPNTFLFDYLPIGAYRSTPAGRQLRANAALVKLNGYDSEQAMLAATNDLEHDWYIEPGRRQLFKALIERDGQVTDFVSEVYRHHTRERIWVRETAYAVRDAQGQLMYYEGTVEDITQSHLAANALADSETRWRLALDAAGDGVWDWRVQTGEEFYSDRLLHMFGFKPGELAHSVATLDERTHPDDLAQMALDREAHFSGRTPTYVNEHRVQCKDGSWKWVLSRGMVVSRDAQGQPLRMIGTHTDITRRKHSEEVIWHQAHFDALTGLPNRRMLRQRLSEALAQAQASHTQVAVLFLDLDNFKQVNDTLGHHVGDALLVEAAYRIRQHIGPHDTLARMGGDEFTLVLANLCAGTIPVAGLVPRLDKLLADLRQPYHLEQAQVFASASVGVALYPSDASQVEDLFRHADQALYVAKGAGRDRWCGFTAQMQAQAQLRARIDTDLRTALQAGQLSVVYQPIVDMRSGRVAKAEALLRWQHPELGAISPAQFIPVAESSGQILALGDWVFTQAAQQVQRWRGMLDAEFQISVNKSPVQCHRSAALSTRWVDQLAEMGLPGQSIAIEITEGLLLDTHPEVARHLSSLRASGMSVSLDDFGTGYSSLTYLQKLEIDCLKIDQSFVRNLSPGSTDLTLCKATIVMAHALGMQVVAEGVETEQQHQWLLEAGCDHGQGYWYARPMPPAQFEAWAQARQPF